MRSFASGRWVVLLAFVVAVGALGSFGSDCVAQTASGRMTPQSVTDTLSELDQDPDRTVRVIVTVRPGTADQVTEAAKKAGANGVNPLFGTQSIVIEGNAAQIRAAVNTGQVTAIQRDTASPTN